MTCLVNCSYREKRCLPGELVGGVDDDDDDDGGGVVVLALVLALVEILRPDENAELGGNWTKLVAPTGRLAADWAGRCGSLTGA